MSTIKCLDDLPSKKYYTELKNGIKFDAIHKKVESTPFSPEDPFWVNTLPQYLENYIKRYIDTWSMSNEGKRCRDLNHILNSIIKRIKEKPTYDESYNLIEAYTNSAATYSLQIQDTLCTRDSELKHYQFKSFDDFDSTIKKLKSKCQEETARTSLTGDQDEMQQYSDRNSSIIAVTSLSGILSLFFFLYKTTSFGSILNNVIRKKTKFGDSLSSEPYHETLEDISELSDGGAHNILYNSIGDF
ncbi:PIR Superfamily Protein [Plasmodium ovale wallikeri]|uniref:PIR Superfamily Protein n=1 Tax=Plasmodium ovale wallikeri TaxID=864142 RepID=A0A1A9APT4_PLAOA|nr:PIR Superfamily Protein [Plasmodium ovale wallikeri]SBT58203.1 PIR Superfamily Protein [Plasmodium ovale wallikeri]